NRLLGFGCPNLPAINSLLNIDYLVDDPGAAKPEDFSRPHTGDSRQFENQALPQFETADRQPDFLDRHLQARWLRATLWHKQHDRGVLRYQSFRCRQIKHLLQIPPQMSRRAERQ